MLEAVPPSICGHLQRGPGRIEARVGRQRLQLLLHARKLADQAAGVGDGVDAVVRHARVRGAPRQLDAPAHRALVRVDHAHLGRLADEHHARQRQRLAELGDHRPHAGAADLLVVGEGEVERHLERARLEVRHHRQHAGEIALHVAGAAAVELAVALDHREGIGVPGLAGHRHHVGVARQGDAADAGRADGGEQAGLQAVRRRHALALDAVPGEVGLDEARSAECWSCGWSCRRRRGAPAAPWPGTWAA